MHQMARRHRRREEGGAAMREWVKANPDAAAREIRELKRENAALRERLEILSKSNEKQTEEYICVDREHGLWKRATVRKEEP
jgi:hypothetical protein